MSEELKENDVAYVDINGYKYNLKDANALNRLKSYVDINLAKQLKQEFTGEIEEDISKIKNFIGLEKQEDKDDIPSLNDQIILIKKELYEDSVAVDESRLDKVIMDIKKIVDALANAGINVDIESSVGESRLETAEFQINTIIQKFKELGYTYNDKKYILNYPSDGDILLFDENKHICTRKVAQEIVKNNKDVVTAGMVFDYIDSNFSDYGEQTLFGKTSKVVSEEFTFEKDIDVYPKEKKYSNSIFVDCTDALLTVRTSETTSYITEGAKLYVPAYDDGIIEIVKSNAEAVAEFTLLNGNKIEGRTNFLRKDVQVINGFKMVGIICTKPGYISKIICTSKCYGLTVRNNEVVSNIPLNVKSFTEDTKKIIFDVVVPVGAYVISDNNPSIELYPFTTEDDWTQDETGKYWKRIK